MRGRGAGVGRGGVVRVVVGGAVAAALTLVGGCTGDDGPPTQPTATVTSSPTPTSEPSPTPMALPTPPAVMAEPTTDGAIAAGTHFIALYDYAFSSGDAGPLMAMSAEGCEVCTYVETSVTQLIARGEVSIGEPSGIVSSRSTEIRPDEWFSAELRVQQSASHVLDADGVVVTASDATTADFIFAMSWLGDRWRVEAVDILVVDE